MHSQQERGIEFDSQIPGYNEHGTAPRSTLMIEMYEEVQLAVETCIYYALSSPDTNRPIPCNTIAEERLKRHRMVML